MIIRQYLTLLQKIMARTNTRICLTILMKGLVTS